jgi:hypothetical protein
VVLGLTRQRAGGHRRRASHPPGQGAFSLTKGITAKYAGVVDA